MLEATAYTTGPLNQYTAIERGEEAAFEPVYDADGNQTLIRTSTGIWQVSYNAENLPVRFVNESAKPWWNAPTTTWADGTPAK